MRLCDRGHVDSVRLARRAAGRAVLLSGRRFRRTRLCLSGGVKRRRRHRVQPPAGARRARGRGKGHPRRAHERVRRFLASSRTAAETHRRHRHQRQDDDHVHHKEHSRSGGVFRRGDRHQFRRVRGTFIPREPYDARSHRSVPHLFRHGRRRRRIRRHGSIGARAGAEKARRADLRGGGVHQFKPRSSRLFQDDGRVRRGQKAAVHRDCGAPCRHQRGRRIRPRAGARMPRAGCDLRVHLSGRRIRHRPADERRRAEIRAQSRRRRGRGQVQPSRPFQHVQHAVRRRHGQGAENSHKTHRARHPRRDESGGAVQRTFHRQVRGHHRFRAPTTD